MKKFGILVLSIFSLGLLSACSFQTDEKYPNILLTTSGIVKKDSSTFFSSYSLYSKRGNEFSITSPEIDIEKYLGKEVIVRGFIDPNIIISKDFISNEKTKQIELSLLEIEILNDEWQKEVFEKLGIEMKIPYFISFKSDAKSLLINLKKDNNNFFLIKKFPEGKQQALKQGEKVVIGNLEFYRYFSGNQKIFYLLENDLQIEFWGEEADIPLFYTIIEGISFLSDETNAVLSVQKNNIFTDNEKSLKKENGRILFQTPPLRVILFNILSSVRENSEIFLTDNPFHIQKIEILDSFVSIEYQEEVSKKRYKILLSAEWKSLFLEELFFHHLAFFSEGHTKVWKLEQGTIPTLDDKYSFFLSDIENEYIVNRPKDFIWYFSSQYKFSIGIPQNIGIEKLTKKIMKEADISQYLLKKFQFLDEYTEKNQNKISRKKSENKIDENNATEENVENVEKKIKNIFNDIEKLEIIDSLGFSFFEKRKVPEILFLIVKGKKDERLEIFSENIIVLPKSETAHFVLIGDANISFSLLQKMADTLVLQ